MRTVKVYSKHFKAHLCIYLFRIGIDYTLGMVKVKLDCLDPLEIGGTCFLEWVRVQLVLARGHYVISLIGWDVSKVAIFVLSLFFLALIPCIHQIYF